MTIYTPSQNDKDKAKLIPEVVTEPVTGFKDDAEEAPPPRLVRVTFFRRNGRSFYVPLLFAMAVLVILACGALGAVVFYRHLHRKLYSGRCGTVYFDATYHKGMKPPMSEPLMRGMMKQPHSDRGMDFIEEDMIVEEDEMFEELHTPAFDEVRESYVRHDFLLNFTAIVDHQFKRCFIMTLNRTAIAPPRTVLELISLGFLTQEYLRRAHVIRQDFEVAYAVEDLSRLGSRIARDCAPYPTQWLEKRVSGVFKRSVNMEKEQQNAYAILSNFPDQQTIYKVFLHNLSGDMLAVKGDTPPAA